MKKRENGKEISDPFKTEVNRVVHNFRTDFLILLPYDRNLMMYESHFNIAFSRFPQFV